MITRQRSALALAGLSAAIAFTGLALATPQEAAAKPAAPAAAATVTHDNSLTPKVRKLVRGHGVAAEARAVTKYWSAARMKAATPLDNAAGVKHSGKAPGKTRQAHKPEGPAALVDPGKAVVKAKAKRGFQAKTFYPNFPYYSFGARTNGKVFFTRAGVNYVCSATVVNSEGKSLVWTAGHCVVDGKVWDSNFAFVPSYSNGSAPYGTWYSRSLTTTSGWYYNRDFSSDVGAAFMNRNFGYRIADYLGSQGITWNQSASYYTCTFGYPQASPYNGAYLVEACGTTTNAGNGTIYLYSGMTGGSSGGAWYYGYNSSTQAGYVDGHNDFIYTSSPSYMYSPYYGNQVASLYNAVRYQSA